MTVVDFIDQTVRGVFSLQSSTQFAVDIHPETNLAVVAVRWTISSCWSLCPH